MDCSLKKKETKRYQLTLYHHHTVFDKAGQGQNRIHISHRSKLFREGKVFISLKLTVVVSSPTATGAIIPMIDPQLLTIAMIVGA